jgi:hypothetical protein
VLGFTPTLDQVRVATPIMEFFLRLKKNYRGVKTKKLRSLQEFEQKTTESLHEAYTCMRRLIAITQGVRRLKQSNFGMGFWIRSCNEEYAM